MDRHEALREKARSDSIMLDRLKRPAGNGIPGERLAPDSPIDYPAESTAFFGKHWQQGKQAGASIPHESAIGSAANLLEGTLVSLTEAVSVLEKRIDTALRPSTPTAEKNQARPQASVVLAEMLNQLEDRAREILQRVNSIIERVELP